MRSLSRLAFALFLLSGALSGIVFASAGEARATTLPRALPSAPPQPLNLTGEFLYSVDASAGTASCNADGSGTITYQSTGTASGPYPGTFSEQGTVTIGPAPGGVPSPGVESPVTGFSATFVIVSGSTTITGAKSFAPTGPVSPGAQCSASIVGLSYARTNVHYFATLGRPGAPYNDLGNGQVTVSFPPTGGPQGSFMDEDFTSIKR
jgi:hypothetical protein